MLDIRDFGDIIIVMRGQGSQRKLERQEKMAPVCSPNLLVSSTAGAEIVEGMMHYAIIGSDGAYIHTDLAPRAGLALYRARSVGASVLPDG